MRVTRVILLVMYISLPLHTMSSLCVYNVYVCLHVNIGVCMYMFAVALAVDWAADSQGEFVLIFEYMVASVMSELRSKSDMSVGSFWFV